MTAQRNTDTLVPARYVIDLVNRDRSFKAATAILEFGPQGAFRLIQSAGGVERIPHIKKVCDFIVSIWEDRPWYFRTDNKGAYTDDDAVCKQRAVKMLIAMARDPRRPVLEKYAGKSYFRNHENRIREVEKVKGEIGIRGMQ